MSVEITIGNTGPTGGPAGLTTWSAVPVVKPRWRKWQVRSMCRYARLLPGFKGVTTVSHVPAIGRSVPLDPASATGDSEMTETAVRVAAVHARTIAPIVLELRCMLISLVI